MLKLKNTYLFTSHIVPIKHTDEIIKLMTPRRFTSHIVPIKHSLEAKDIMFKFNLHLT